ncbi:5-formyltetrahydrofolate cyclo-ligase [Peziza echinospora]|nr:5-formyltetrahydrofolate cyclo-ligase [Peziza echinospora]KAI5783863.1 5-formyltetrahydrofolate cyclo-ligase [Peziza echinospora]
MASSPLIRSYASKRALRALVKSTLRTISDESLASQSLKCMQTILTLPEYLSSTRISVYLSMPHREIQTHHLLEHAFANGKEVFVPYIHKNPSAASPTTTTTTTATTPKEKAVEAEKGKDKDARDTPPNLMDMLHLPSLSAYLSLPRDSWGIPTLPSTAPSEARNSLSVEEGESRGLDIVILPGVAFGTDGRRLGHGKGYYDYWLQRCSESMNPSGVEGKRRMPVLVGTALEEQVFGEGEVPVDGKDWLVDVLVTGDGRVVRRPGSLVCGAVVL